jgi:hypothetical protein
LRLGQLHPVLLLDRLDREFRRRGQPRGSRRFGQQGRGIGVRLEQRDDAGMLPARRIDRSRFAELRLLSVCGSASSIDATAAGFNQGIAAGVCFRASVGNCAFAASLFLTRLFGGRVRVMNAGAA